MNKKLVLILLATIMVFSSLFVLVSCGEEVSIDHLEIYSMPKTEYSLGESLDIRDAKIKVVYKDNTEKLVDITSSMISGFDSNTLGEQYIKVYYENHSTVFTVTVSRSTVTSVELVIPDANVNYIEGQLLRTDGTYMQINFLDGTVERINVTKEMCTGYDANKLGSQIINVTGYLDGVEYSSSFVVTVTERELTGIEVTTVPTKQIYYVGDSALDLSGGVLFLKYNSGYAEYVDMTDVNGKPIDGLEVSWDNSKVDNRSIVNVTYGFKTTSFQIQVKVRDVSSYEISVGEEFKNPMQNLALDLTGLTVTINYNNGEHEIVTLPNEKVTIVDYDSSITGKQEVTIVFSYGGVELATRGKMELNVIPREALTLEMVTTPTIYQDTEFDVTEFELCVVYNNGERGEAFNLNNAMIAWENGIPRTSYSQEGSYSWYIIYRAGVELTYNFEVVGLEVIDVELQSSNNVTAYLGENPITDNVLMTITYNNGMVKEDVQLVPEMVVNYDQNKAGLHIANINYYDEYEEGFIDQETVLYVTVVREISDVIIKGNYRDVYIVGETFTAEGMELEVSYKGEGSTATIYVPADTRDDFYKEWSFSTEKGLTFTEVGQHIIYLENAGLREAESFVITVKNNVTSIGPLYKKVDGVLKQVSGFEKEADLYKNVGFETVLEGVEIDLTDYFIFVDFESVTHDEYIQVTKEMIDYNAKYTALGEREVTIYYPDRDNYTGDEFTMHKTIVTVLEKSVIGIKLLSAPDRTIYYQDENNYNGVSTDYAGMMLSLEYDNGTFGAINIQEAIAQSRLNIGNIDVREQGLQSISFSYRTIDDELYEGSFEIQVVDSTPVSISWASETIPYVELSLGSAFDVSGIGYIDNNNMIKPLDELLLSVLYSGNTVSVRVELSTLYEDGLISVEGYNANQTGIQDVRLVHKNDSSLYVTVKTNVVERTLKEINLVKNGAVVGDGDKIEVIQSAVIDLTYLSLQLVFSDDVKTLIPMAAEYVNVSESNPNGYDVNDATIGEREVTISFTYANETTPVTKVVTFNVKEKSLVKIEINAIPQQFYVEHEEFNVSQGSIMLYYDNGTTAEKPLSEASITNSSASFYVDKSRFDNSEFTGFSKVQPIKVRYGNCTASYNVYMRDRRNVEVTFNAENQYSYTYGEVGFEDSDYPVSITMMGYEAYGDTLPEKNISNYTIEYIPKAIWQTQKRVQGVDYTIVPREVGEYVIVISYNVDLDNVQDSIHNAYEDDSKTLVINKKPLYVYFLKQSKVYHTDTPMVYIVMSGSDVDVTKDSYLDNASTNPLEELFIKGDGLRTASFNPDYLEYYSSTKAYLWGGEIDGKPVPVKDEYGMPLLIDLFDIVYKNKSTGITIDVNEGTAAGSYSLAIDNQFVSPNYNVVYKDVDFTIEKRKVGVIPQSLTYAYGIDVVPSISYTTTKARAKDADGNFIKDEYDQYVYISDSGLYGSDVLLGSPRSTKLENRVGEYDIDSAGSLAGINNPNYEIDLIIDDAPKVKIVARNIYVKTDSVIKVYGEPFVTPQVKFFSDPACTTESGAFATGDNLATIGNLVYPEQIDVTTNVGNYKYSCEIDNSGAGSMNYNVVYVSGYVEVVKRPVNVIAIATTKIYGEQDPVIGFNITPIAGENASGIVNNDAFEGTLSRVQGNNYGEYTIQLGTLNNDNYDIRFTSAAFSILRKNLYVYVAEEDLSKVYDGKVPAIDNYTLYESREEGAIEYIDDEARQFISFNFKGESKGFGIYEVGVKVSSNNYSIALYNENGYSYEIAKRKVAITRNEYFDLPDGLEYKGSAYQFYAQINPSDLQHVYNNDGSYATDDNNKPLFDDPSVTLSIQSATNQGTYTVNVVELADKNYEIDVENTKPITFSILPRTVKVVIKTNADNNTIEREFNNQSAYISAADYTLENLIDGEGIPYFNIGIYLGDKVVSATNVNYDSTTGEIVGYDIKIVENSVDPNYVVELAADYKYKIVPKGVIIRIYDKYLSKEYDGIAPSIKTSMFAPVSAVTGFDSNDVSFEFIREENDGRDNTCVGNYSIKVTCMDGNFNVTTQQPHYIYQIVKSNVSVSINSQSMEKAYDGNDFSFDVDDLTFSDYYGNSLIVHNFAHKQGNNDPYQTFKEQLKAIQTAINTLDSQIGLVDFSELSYAKNNLTTSITKANELKNILNSSNNPMQDDNSTDIASALDTIITYLNDAISAINNGEAETAQGLYRQVSNSLMPLIKTTYDKEQSYVAFIFGTEIDNTSNKVGSHPFTVEFSDYNRNFNLLNANRNVNVSKSTLYINVPTLETTYGVTKDSLGKIYFELYDPRTGSIIDTESANFKVENEPTIIGDFKNVGNYDVDVSNMYICEVSGIKSENYVLLPGEIGNVIINKAILSLVIQDVSDSNIFVYGKTVESSQFTGQYNYLASNTIPPNPSTKKEAELIEQANAWAEANGYVGMEHTSLMNLYYGGLKFDDKFETILRTNAVKYNCYLNGESGTQIFDTSIFDAGDYKLGATGFKADNYEIRVIPGVLTVAKRELTIYTQGDYYEKEYGEENIDFIYTNFAGNEDASSVMVYVDNNEDGIFDEEVCSLSEMIWNYTYGENGNPLDPLTPVGDDEMSITPLIEKYVLKNYTIDFNNIIIKVVKAPLYCTLSPVEGNRISSVYMSLPDADSYQFTYNGLKNGERAEDLINKKPTINFMNGGSYFDAGTHVLGQANLVTTGIELANYELLVEEFQYQVDKRKVKVSLKDVDPSMSTLAGQLSITPYMANVVNTSAGISSVEIISGQYGFTNFYFEHDNDEVAAAFSSVAITRYTKSEGVMNEVKTETGSTHTEIYRYSEMYKHRITGTINYETNTATLQLSNMSMNSINFEFEYVPFEVKVYSSIVNVGVNLGKKLVASDLALTDDEINELITFSILKSSNEVASATIKEMLANGSLSVDGAIPNATSVNALMKYTLTDSAYNYQLATAFTNEYYTNYNYGTLNTNVLTVSDSRVTMYDYSNVASCELPLRFYPQTTAVVNNPTLSDSIEYKKQYSSNSMVTITAQETLFNAMALELSVRPNASVKMPRLEIGFNADLNGNVISLAFNNTSNNVVTVKVQSGSKVGSATYAVSYGNLFDGNMHEIRAYLDKESLTLIISIDGTSGEILSLAGILTEDEQVVLDSPEDIVESSTLSLTLGGDYIIRNLTLSEQGLYDGLGAYISLPINSASVVKVTTLLDTFNANITNLNALFGLNRLNLNYTDEGMQEIKSHYSVAYFINGQRVEYDSTATSIDLPSGIHFVEMALYKDGALVDYEAVHLNIVRMSRVSYIDAATGHDEKVFVPGTQLPLYAISGDYVAQGNEDTTLVATDSQNQYGYYFGNNRLHSDIYPYSYFNMSFVLEPSATYDSATGTAKYAIGNYTTTIELFSSSEFGTVAGARAVSDATYQGAALEITRVQSADVSFGSSNNAYTYTIRLVYYVNGKTDNNSIIIASGVTDCAYEVIVYKDRNTSYYGNNGIIVSIRSLYSDTANLYEFNAEELNADRAKIYVQANGLGDRMTVYNVSYEEEPVTYRDYLVAGQYVSSEGSVMLQKDESLTLINNAGTALYSNYNNLVFNFNVDDDYGISSGDILTINLAESKLDGSGNGVKLVYDLLNNKIAFSFYFNGIYAIAQEWTLDGEATGSHKLQVKFDKELVLDDANTYVGGDSANDNLVFENLILTETMGEAVVHYTTVTVIIDGNEKTFYMPLYNDLGCWIMENGLPYSTTNNYSSVTGLTTTTPTFLPLYTYTSVETNVDGGIMVEGYMVTMGENNTYTTGAVTESPAL